MLTAVGNLEVNPEKTLMVGDSPVDIQSGKNAGVLTAAVAWSLKGEDMLREYEPDFILQDMTDLCDLVSGGGTSL
ncbi:Pyrophosphatase PpaX [compost metagenome]